ncbi:MRL1 [Symbiodinium sp. CCMP2592]|nr:MRL1 [Symbiodinium sp. CCMP2592]
MSLAWSPRPRQASFDYHSRRIPTWRKPLRQRDTLVQFTKDISQDGSVRNWEDVLALLSMLPSLRLRPDEVFFGAALGRLGKERQWHFALTTLESMTVCESLQPNLITCSATVAACAKALKWFRACAILAHMRKDRSIEANTIAFDSAITACGGRSGSWAQAVHVYDILRVQGLAPISMTYNSAISAFEYRQHWQRGLEFLQELFAHRPGKRIAANVVSFNAALACCRKVSQWQWGLHLWKGVRRHLEIDAPHLREDKSADDVTYGCAVSACDHGWQWQWGLQLLCEAVFSGLRVGIPTMNSAISASAKSKKWHTCLALLREMPSERLAPTRVSFTSALGAFSGPEMTRSKSSLVLELLMEMVEQKIQPNALGLDIATQAAEASAFHSLAPGLVAQTRLAGAAACEATEDTFEEEDRHGEHSGLAIVAADSLEWHGLLDERLKASLQRSSLLPNELSAAERQSAQKHAMALQRGEVEVQRAREHSEWLEVEGSSISATVIEDLEAACSLCSEARCSAEDARYMQEESVTLAQILLESHAILADYDASLETARKTRELAEESEALRNSLHFENALAMEFRQQLREEAKSVKAVLVEYARLRGRREDALRGSALALRGWATSNSLSAPTPLDGACLGAAVDLETLRNSLHLLDGQPSTRDAMQASFYGSSIQSDPDASPQSPSLTATDLTLACADVSPLARVSQISQESVLDQSQATLSHGHLSDEVDADVPPGEISQRGSGSSCLMDAESPTGEACNLSPHAGTEMVEDGGLIRRSVLDEKDAEVLDFDVEADADPQDDGHLSMSTTFEAAPDADASTKDASPARSDGLEGEVQCIRRPTQQAVPTSRDAEVQTEPEAQPEKAVKAPSTATVPARSVRSSDIGEVSLGRRATSPARSCRTVTGRHEKATSPLRSPMTASQDSTAASPAKDASPRRAGDFAPDKDRLGNLQLRKAASPRFEQPRAQVEAKATSPRKGRKPFRPSSPTPRLITKHPPSTLHKSQLAARPLPESRPSEGQGQGPAPSAGSTSCRSPSQVWSPS